MKTFKIASDRHYGWVTGVTSDGNQVICADNASIYFDPEGQFLTISDLLSPEQWEARIADLISREETIHVRAFNLTGKEIGIRRLEEAERAGLHEFRLGDDFWLAADGTVNSH